MADERGKRDVNREVVALGATDNAALETKMLRVDPTTFRLKTTSTISSAVMETGFTTPVSTTLNLATADTRYLLPAAEQADRTTIVLYNKSDTDIYIGSSAVTTATGILLTAEEKMSFDSKSGLYAVCGVNNKDLNILELK